MRAAVMVDRISSNRMAYRPAIFRSHHGVTIIFYDMANVPTTMMTTVVTQLNAMKMYADLCSPVHLLAWAIIIAVGKGMYYI